MSVLKSDSYYFLAKKYGFRSRAAFKLIEIDKKYEFLNKSRGIIDLCAAPGSWTQVVKKISPSGSLVVGIDAQKIRPIRGCYFLRGDITSPNIVKTINKIKEVDKRLINTVLHDGAPKIGTSWLKDVLNQNELTLLALKIGVVSLERGGTFVSKVFRSEFLHGILYISRCFFENVLLFKPTASRQSSTEIYLICKKFKAPKNFDPFFFSSNYIFSFFQFRFFERKKNWFQKENFLKNTQKNILFSIRNSSGEYYNFTKNLHKEGDELESHYGISIFSKIFKPKFPGFNEDRKTTENSEMVIKWSQTYLPDLNCVKE